MPIDGQLDNLLFWVEPISLENRLPRAGPPLGLYVYIGSIKKQRSISQEYIIRDRSKDSHLRKQAAIAHGEVSTCVRVASPAGIACSV